MEFPEGLHYTKTHEWVKEQTGQAKVGITEFAQKELSDVVYVELPEIGREVKAGEAVAVVESVKAAFDIYSPLSGKVVEVNSDLENDPSLVNSDSYGKGWFFVLEGIAKNDIEKLMDKTAYEKHVQQQDH